MKALLSVTSVILSAALTVSCTMPPAQGAEAAAPSSAAPAQAASPSQGVPPAWQGGPALAVTAPGEPNPAIKMNAPAPALTEALNSAMDRLAEQSAENARLKDTVAGLQKQLADRQAAAADLQRQLDECDVRIKEMEGALEKWKQDVLGFRDEMRNYEEAQIQVLQEVVNLLKGFKKDKGGSPQEGGTAG